MRLALGLVAMLGVGCGSVESKSDAGMGQHWHYVIDHQFLPVTPAQAMMYSLDLDGHAGPDNRLGDAAAMAAMAGIDLQGTTSASVDNGTLITLLDVQAGNLTNAANVGAMIYVGSNPSPSPCLNASDTACRRHLAGNASFTVASGQPYNSPVIGAITNGDYVSDTHGNMRIQIAPFGALIQFDMFGARVRLDKVAQNG